jgi:hypothetical protein
MEYFKTKAGNSFFGDGLALDTIDCDIISYEKQFDKDFHIRITKEEFINAYEQVIKKLNEKVYGSKQEAIHG